MGFIGLTLGFSLGCRSAIAMLVNLGCYGTCMPWGFFCRVSIAGLVYSCFSVFTRGSKPAK